MDFPWTTRRMARRHVAFVGVALCFVATSLHACLAWDDRPHASPTHVAAPSAAPACGTLQEQVDATPAGGTVDLTGCTYSLGATVRRPITILGATIRSPIGARAITITADDVTLDGLTIIGSQAAAYAFDEAGVFVNADPTTPVQRLTIRDSEITTFGGFGAYLRNVEDLRLEGNHVHDVVYAGLMVLSGRVGTIAGNTVERIGYAGHTAPDQNAYGISLTTGPGDAAPTADFTVTGNAVQDVPTWHALDTHGGRRITLTNNIVRRSSRAIFITSDGSGNRATDVIVTGNQLLSPSPVTFNLLAVTTYDTVNVTVSGNTATGWGSGRFHLDEDGLSTSLSVSANTVRP